MGLVLIAAWLGLVTGFGEVLSLGLRKLAFDRMLFLGPHIVWMTPLADLILFVALGLALAFAAWRWSRVVTIRTAVGVLTFVGFLSLTLIYPRLHRIAQLVLSAGLAVQCAYLVGAREPGFRRMVRRSVGWMALLLVAVMAGMLGRQWYGRRQAGAGLPAARAGAPNVLLLILDTVRAQSLSLYGNPRPTSPNLVELARTGTTFERALAPAPWTTPSHASMFTGRYPHELSVARSKVAGDGVAALDDEYPTVAEALAARGYLTAAFVANFEYAGYEVGLDRGFAHFDDYPRSPLELVFSSALARATLNSWKVRKLLRYYDAASRRTAPDINGSFLRWLDRKESGRPFFAFLNYYEAHEPYLPPRPYEGKFGPIDVRKKSLIYPMGVHQALRSGKRGMNAAEIQGELDAYEESIAYLDDHLGRLFQELRRRDLMDNTLVIVTSDHGEQFGEHRLFAHGNSLYWPSLHIPLVLRLPARVPAGVRVPAPVGARDLAATILDLAGADNELGLPGESVARYWNRRDSMPDDQPPVRSEVTSLPRAPKEYPISRGGDLTSLVTGRYHYIRNGDGKEELYDLEADPAEERDLANTAEGRDLLEQFRRHVDPVDVGQAAASGAANKSGM